MNASPPGDEDEDDVDAGVADGPADIDGPDGNDGAPPLLVIDVVWKLSMSCDMTFRWASSLKNRK